MSNRSHRFVALVDRLQREHPELLDPVAAIADGRVAVNGAVALNPRRLVRHRDAVRLTAPQVLRGALKMRSALGALHIDAEGLVVADVGASTGGFTSALLEAGARRVYAIDAGYGQLLGSLRQDPRVCNLERTNVGSLTSSMVGEPIDLVTMDLSYLALSEAVPQLEALSFRENALLLALVKPIFELGLAVGPGDEGLCIGALDRATAAIDGGHWTVQSTCLSPVPGRRGSREFFVHARRR